MHVLIFEGSHWNTFAPLSLSRPVFALMSGMSTLLEKQLRALEPTRLTLWVRPGLVEYTRTRIVPYLKVPTQVNVPLDDEPALLMSGRTLHFAKYERPHESSVIIDEGNIVRSAYAKSPGLAPADVQNRTSRWMELLELPQTMSQSRMVHHVWDLINWNEESLVQDFIHTRTCLRPPKEGPYHLIDADDICLGDQASIGPGAVLDASRGPICIAAGASIGANSVVQGPCYIGEYATIAPLSYIRAGTSIGPMCRVGGEISNSILQGHSNKAHEGYLGNSYLGEWVNFGAGTTTSNVKTTYGEISMRIGDKEFKTGRRSLGSIVGDHTKTAIGTRLTTGTYIGYCSMLAGSTSSPKFVPSFTFWTDKGTEQYRLDKAREVMAGLFSRGNRPWTDTDQQQLNYVAETAPGVES